MSLNDLVYPYLDILLYDTLMYIQSIVSALVICKGRSLRTYILRIDSDEGSEARSSILPKKGRLTYISTQ